MSQAEIGSFSGMTTPEENMVDVFKKNELKANPNSYLNFSQMVLRKISLSCPESTKVKINGKEITLFTGEFELGMDQILITSLVFPEAVDVKIYYLF